MISVLLAACEKQKEGIQYGTTNIKGAYLIDSRRPYYKKTGSLTRTYKIIMKGYAGSNSNVEYEGNKSRMLKGQVQSIPKCAEKDFKD